MWVSARENADELVGENDGEERPLKGVLYIECNDDFGGARFLRRAPVVDRDLTGLLTTARIRPGKPRLIGTG